MAVRISVRGNTRAPSGSTNAYVFDDVLLVDPADRSDELDRVVEKHDVGHVAVTHHHPDHVGGVAEYAREYDLTVWARAGREEEFAKASNIQPDRTFQPRTDFPIGDGIEVWDLPGHAPEHVGFAAAGTAATGDLAVADGSVVIAPPDGDMRAYLSSLRRVLVRNPDQLLPGHGPLIENPRRTCRRLLAHRLDRENRIREAVEDGTETPDDLVDAVYDKDVSAVYDLARATVTAHLEKLAVEGTVWWDGERARPVA